MLSFSATGDDMKHSTKHCGTGSTNLIRKVLHSAHQLIFLRMSQWSCQIQVACPRLSWISALNLMTVDTMTNSRSHFHFPTFSNPLPLVITFQAAGQLIYQGFRHFDFERNMWTRISVSPRLIQNTRGPAAICSIGIQTCQSEGK